jgi:hypothetical protein
METTDRFTVKCRQYELRIFAELGQEESYEVWLRVGERKIWPLDPKTQLPFTRNQLIRQVQNEFIEQPH